MTAMWSRMNSKKIPKLATVLEAIKPKKPVNRQTPEQMLEMAKTWQARMTRGE